MTDEEPPPATGKTRIVNGKLQEWNGTAWVPFEFLRPQGTGEVGHPPYIIYKIDDDESEPDDNADSGAAGNDDTSNDEASK